MFLYTGIQRNMAIAVKYGSDPALEYTIAKILAEDIRPGDVLIPAPNHNGYAEYTLRIAKQIEKMSGARVCDCIRVLPHDMCYKAGTQLRYCDKRNLIHLYMASHIIAGNRYLFVDNVIDTGATYDAASEIVPTLKPLVFTSRGKRNGIGPEWRMTCEADFSLQSHR